MSYLLDTNVVSETSKANPSPNVVGWLENVSVESIFISTLTLGEIRYGIDKLTDVGLQQRLNEWVERDVVAWFGPRLLPIDAKIADTWGRLRNRAGRTLPAIDGLVAATALANGLTLVTRNVKDFQGTGAEVIDPWNM